MTQVTVSPVGIRRTEFFGWTTPQRFDIKAGKHTIKLISGSDKANVAQIMITDDPSWDPVEGMSLLGKMPPVSR